MTRHDDDEAAAEAFNATLPAHAAGEYAVCVSALDGSARKSCSDVFLVRTRGRGRDTVPRAQLDVALG